MGLVVEAAAPMPVTLAEVKAYLRIAGSEEDALLAGLVRGAAATGEAFTGRAMVARAVSETVAAGGAWTRLAAGPVRSIEAVDALAPDGTATALEATDYLIDIDAHGEGWVRVVAGSGAAGSGAAGSGRRARVRYTVGLAADANGVPEPLRHGVVRLAAHLYAHRAESDGSAPSAAPPAAVTALWRPWRRLRLG